MLSRHVWGPPLLMMVMLAPLVAAVSASVRIGPGLGPVADPRDVAVTLRPFAAGFERPVFATGSADGSGDVFVVEQGGRVRRVSASGVTDPEPLLDISGRVLLQHERGLLGFALHPDFPDDGRLYVTYSGKEDGATILSEFTLGALDVPEETERTLLTIAQPYKTHKAGMLAFDRDGMLLMGVGDGGHQDDPLGVGLDVGTLLGKLLRLDVDGARDRSRPYAIPPDNGFLDVPSARPEIHAIGLRNPWRFSVDRATGELVIADVGQRRTEEINLFPRGRRRVSFGWSDMEGRECFGERTCTPADHVEPAVAYAHVSSGDDSGTGDDHGHCGVIGGYTYRGSAVPLLHGLHLFSDFCSGTIWAVRARDLAHGDVEPTVVGRLPAEHGQPHSFGEDDDGELMLVTSSGELLRIGAEPAT